MEIKQGDKVRVSDATPWIYTRNQYKGYDCKVEAVAGDGAIVSQLNVKFPIPTKYLVKVDAEVGVGDKVVVHYPSGDRIGRIKEVMLDGTYDIDYGGGCTGHNITRSQIEPYTARKIKVGDAFKSDSINGTVKYVDGNCVGVLTDDGWNIEVSLYDIKEQTEAEEVARIRQLETELDEFRKAELDRMLHPEKYHTYEVTIDNVAMDWQHYEADLAKEIALKVANKFNTPHEAAEYAVSVAKAVVENLRNKQI